MGVYIDMRAHTNTHTHTYTLTRMCLLACTYTLFIFRNSVCIWWPTQAMRF